MGMLALRQNVLPKVSGAVSAYFLAQRKAVFRTEKKRGYLVEDTPLPISEQIDVFLYALGT